MVSKSMSQLPGLAVFVLAPCWRRVVTDHSSFIPNTVNRQPGYRWGNSVSLPEIAINQQTVRPTGPFRRRSVSSRRGCVGAGRHPKLSV